MPQIPDIALRVMVAEMAAFSAVFRFRRLRRADPPPVGLVKPQLRPLMLGGEGWDLHGLLYVSLLHGDPLDDSAPFVVITTRYQDLTNLAPEPGTAPCATRARLIHQGR